MSLEESDWRWNSCLACLYGLEEGSLHYCLTSE